MIKRAAIVLALGMVPAAAAWAFAADAAKKAPGIESPGYVWNAPEDEKIEALKLTGHVRAGRESYEMCSACHLPSGAGRPDGSIPQLAGQHATVIIKQIADIRAGLRDNPVMYRYAMTLSDPQELADVAAYIQTLCIPLDHGKGSGDAALLAKGKNLYVEECSSCHGSNGEGDARKFYPVLAGQHYKYLLRQVTAIRDGKRRNADPDMVEVVKKYGDRDLDAVVEYMASLTMPGAMCKAGPAYKWQPRGDLP